MTRYFFDTRDDSDFIDDEIGLELPDLEAVKRTAAIALAELARDVLPGKLKRVLKVEVRDAYGPLMEAIMTFEAIILRPMAAV